MRDIGSAVHSLFKTFVWIPNSFSAEKTRQKTIRQRFCRFLGYVRLQVGKITPPLKILAAVCLLESLFLQYRDVRFWLGTDQQCSRCEGCRCSLARGTTIFGRGLNYRRLLGWKKKNSPISIYVVRIPKATLRKLLRCASHVICIGGEDYSPYRILFARLVFLLYFFFLLLLSARFLRVRPLFPRSRQNVKNPRWTGRGGGGGK